MDSRAHHGRWVETEFSLWTRPSPARRPTSCHESHLPSDASNQELDPKGESVKNRAKLPTRKMQGKGPVRYSQTGGKNSPLAIGIDFRFARVPDAYTYADCISLKNDKEIGIATVLLGQADADSGKVRDCISIVMPSVALFGQFLMSTKAVEETLAAQLKALKLQAVRRSVPSETSVRATRFANVIFLATSTAESSLDFYYMPGRDIFFARMHQTDIDLEPVIRVIIPLPVLQYFLELCRPYALSPTSTTMNHRSANRASAI